uniref:Transposon Ty3-I Gag-Pol polyprotein n=1 Tax=Cajanus cajan TaxID=3821 RepID=A0A151QXI6_CAJCA|nr:Transposon Ty3-I Gag-Pol polyprotein [Cajanus cajan]
MDPDIQGKIMALLTDNADLFAWTSADMPGIDPNFICHKLAIYKEAKPVSQRQRKLGGERREAVKLETQKLLDARFIREIKYTTWLANVVMVKKSNGNWRMCIDYTDLNKACPKDSYPLPNIDRLVDGASGATYQRLMDKVFTKKIGRNLEVYVDDMVIKTKSPAEHVQDIAEIFQQVRRHNMRLNPEKCVFGVQGGKFLGFMITCRGIEANPDKFHALINMRSPQNHKEVQRLAGRLASLSCRVLQDTKKRYQTIEKLALALVTSTRRLRPYFQSHQIVVKTDYPIKKILRKLDLAGRMTAWSIELSEYDIRYESRGPFKAQYGSSNVKGSGAGIILEGPNNMMLELAIKFDFQATNNQAEYEALLAGLRLAKDVGVKRLMCCSDSKLITKQIKHIPREQNVRANLLSKLASTKRPGQHKTIIQETIGAPSQDFMAISTNTQGQSTWMSDIWKYLTDGTLPDSKIEASKIKIKSAHFTIEAGDLFKKGFSTPLLKCLNPDQAQYVMDEIHRGICGMHSGARSMATRVIRAGLSHFLVLHFNCIYLTKYGIDQIWHHCRGPSVSVKGCVAVCYLFLLCSVVTNATINQWNSNSKFLLVGIDYFTKWIEAEPLAKITAANVQKFTWKKIICRYGLPQAITTDNGKQFIDKNFEQFLKQLGINHKVSSVEHPYYICVGVVRVSHFMFLFTNDFILFGGKKDHYTTTQETPYKLTYGSDVMIPVEVGEPSHRRLTFDETQNVEQLRLDLDLLDETRECAKIQEEACKLRAARLYNSRLKPRSFREGDLVWRATRDARKDTSVGKFAANWEGPFRISECLQNGAYRLVELSGKVLPRTWNATNLKFYYS